MLVIGLGTMARCGPADCAFTVSQMRPPWYWKQLCDVIDMQGSRPRERSMRGRSRFISDMAQVANGAASALGGIREELDNIVKQRTERGANAQGLVTREEFDALRTRHDAMAARVAELESRLAEAGKAAAPRKKAAKKAASTRRKESP